MNHRRQAAPVGRSLAATTFSHDRFEPRVGYTQQVRPEDELNGRQIVCVRESSSRRAKSVSSARAACCGRNCSVVAIALLPK